MTYRRFRAALYTAALFCGATLSAATSARAQSRDIRITKFDDLLEVRTDGTLDVTEHLTIRFTGEWHGINRDISLHHNTAQGRATKLDLDIVSVTDAQGNSLRVEQSNQDNGWTHALKIYIPNAIDADREIIVRYRVSNAVRFYYKDSKQGEFDELYWNVTGTDWAMPIDTVHARVVLPDGVPVNGAAVYTGFLGSTAHDADIVKNGSQVDFFSRHEFAPGDGMTIGVGWPTGHITGRPTERRERFMGALRWSPLVIPILVFFFAYGRWNRTGRDPREESFVVHYEPIKDMTPAELGTLVDNTADMPDITATLVDLAVRGYIRITELDDEHLFGLVKNKDYQIDILRKRPEWNDLKPHEQAYLDSLGQSSPLDEYQMKMSELRNRFYKYIPKIKNAIYDGLVAIGYYAQRPDIARGRFAAYSALIMLATIGLTVLSFNGKLPMFSPIAGIVAAVISVVILGIFAALMPARTVAGARAREATLGFKEFLSRVEEERYKKMITSPELFERYLPYAMAFGVADKWANAFQDIYREPPTWYVGGTGPFNASSFSQSISTMSAAASSSMGSSPSGSGGGGSSGGGSGGGGGSGF
jgi:Predicted membrane protein (DUF2207)